MNLEERLLAVTTRGKGLSHRELVNQLNTDSAFKAQVAALYMEVFKRPISGTCSSCYADAYIELMLTNPEAIMEKSKLKYWLRAGALLHDRVNLDPKKMMSNANITNELAVYHLATNPSCIDLFSTLAPKWEEDVANYNSTHAVAQTSSITSTETSEETAVTGKLTSVRAKRTKAKTE